MVEIINTNKIYERLECSGEHIQGDSFNSCTFRDCNIPDCDLSGGDFSDCVFENCNLSNIKLIETGLKDVLFKNCKLTGTNFSDCRDILFEVSFEDCIMDFCIFSRNNLRKTLLSGCRVNETEFSECDLKDALFRECDLLRTVFIQNDLSGADFRTSLNYIIDPDINKVKGAKFSYPGVLGLLEGYDIIIE